MKMKMLIIGVIIVLLTISKIVSADVYFEIAGHFTCVDQGNGWYSCTCEEPYDCRCVLIVLYSDGTYGIIFGYEDPKDGSIFSQNDEIKASSLTQPSLTSINFKKEE